HRRLHAGPAAGAAPRSTDLDRELGIAGGAETRGAPCRWLACLWLQHEPGTVRPGLVGRPGGGGGTRARCRRVPERHRNDVVLRRFRVKIKRSGGSLGGRRERAALCGEWFEGDPVPMRRLRTRTVSVQAAPICLRKVSMSK